MGSQELFLWLVSVLLLIGSCLDFSKSSSVLAPPCSTDKITKAKACIGFSMSFSRIWLRILLDLNCLKVELFSTRVARVSGEDCPSNRVHSRFELQLSHSKMLNFFHILGTILEPVCCKKRQKNPNQETGLVNSGPQEDLNDTKLIVND
jgi:hypothetical protein